jgi:methyl-accepting chemotaxis protein
VSSIASSAREQSVGLNEINTAVNDLDHVTQQNAAMFEETTAASHALTTEADALAAAVARFDLGAKKEALQSGQETRRNVAVPKTKLASKPVGNLALKQDPVETSEIDTGWEEF